jgi:endonuclease/exonuclease/phosphatase family metal-dependent hydrolase
MKTSLYIRIDQRRFFAVLLLLSVCVFTLAGCRAWWSQPPVIVPPAEKPPADGFLQKRSPQHIRLMSFNVGWDSIFPDDDPLNDPWRSDSTGEAFIRILQAVQPDVLCLQEINPARDPRQVSRILDAALPLDGGRAWQAHSGVDNVIAARFSLSMQDARFSYRSGAGGLGHAMALVDLPDEIFTSDLYLVCAHFKSQGGAANIRLRQAHADALIAWLRDARTPGGEVDLPAATPFILLGDFNVYDTDPAHHLTTLLEGDIVNEARYGADFAPDWDGTPLADALPSHNAAGEVFYTWRDDTQEFNPGVLDRILYADSVLAVEHAFVLNTMMMAPDELEAASLQAADVALDPAAGRYDHLPLVVDLSLK